SAFNAMTRGVYRALGESNPAVGQLVSSAPAHIAQWEATELMVQAPDTRVAAWSTDPRARIPLLPVLEEGNLPRLLGLYLNGSKVHVSER
ncbi:MAG: amidohydrolase, partial [Rothia sp. (in: high G+C Gram-positive bacteria)]|nr:amidohydrolase [Rothia sp. (in: high G+C Gram-positive bacteria)]